jgi:hypothetical protein
MPQGVPARFNYWDCPTIQEMEAGIQNISVLWDGWDEADRGLIDYSGWLGGTEAVQLYAQADRTGAARDVVLIWETGSAGESLVFRSNGGPDGFVLIATADSRTYRDVGALDDPNALLLYRVIGPCVE